MQGLLFNMYGEVYHLGNFLALNKWASSTRSGKWRQRLLNGWRREIKDEFVKNKFPGNSSCD